MAFHHVYKLLSVNIVHAWMKKLWIQSSLHCTCKAKITPQWFFIKWNNKSRAQVRGALSNCGGWEAFLLCAQPFYARSAVEYKLKRRHAFTGLPHFCEKVYTLILLLCCSLLKFSVILSGAVGNFFFIWCCEDNSVPLGTKLCLLCCCVTQAKKSNMSLYLFNIYYSPERRCTAEHFPSNSFECESACIWHLFCFIFPFLCHQEFRVSCKAAPWSWI